MDTLLGQARPFELVELLDYPEGGIASRRISTCSGGSIALFAFDGGQALDNHTAPFDTMVQLLEGEAEFDIGGRTHALRAGQCIVMPANLPHAVRAITRFKMLLTNIKG